MGPQVPVRDSDTRSNSSRAEARATCVCMCECVYACVCMWGTHPHPASSILVLTVPAEPRQQSTPPGACAVLTVLPRTRPSQHRRRPPPQTRPRAVPATRGSPPHTVPALVPATRPAFPLAQPATHTCLRRLLPPRPAPGPGPSRLAVGGLGCAVERGGPTRVEGVDGDVGVCRGEAAGQLERVHGVAELGQRVAAGPPRSCVSE